MNSSCDESLAARVERHRLAWGVAAGESRETSDSVLVFGTRGSQAVVLKVIKRCGDEWHCGDVLRAFDGHGVVRPLEFVAGAVLMERLQPGTAAAAVALEGLDEEATGIIARVVNRMSPHEPPAAVRTLLDLSTGFSRYLACDDRQIPTALVERAHRIHLELCASQTRVRLLHGDLHHHNVLFDRRLGWVAVDPKGLVGEPEYEIGAALRNPREEPALSARADTVERRCRIFEDVLDVNASRVLRWAFAQAVLAAIWLVEDGIPVRPDEPFLALARTTESMLGAAARP